MEEVISRYIPNIRFVTVDYTNILVGSSDLAKISLKLIRILGNFKDNLLLELIGFKLRKSKERSSKGNFPTEKEKKDYGILNFNGIIHL